MISSWLVGDLFWLVRQLEYLLLFDFIESDTGIFVFAWCS